MTCLKNGIKERWLERFKAADSKSAVGVIPHRGFESLSFRRSRRVFLDLEIISDYLGDTIFAVSPALPCVGRILSFAEWRNGKFQEGRFERGGPFCDSDNVIAKGGINGIGLRIACPR